MRKLPLILLATFAAASAMAADSDQASATLPPTTIFGSVLNENTPVGETGRPEWTSARRFTGTRVYIQQDPWEVGVESWWRLKNNRDGTLSHRLLEEVEIGLPYRMQLDIYNDIEGDNLGRFHDQSVDFELRYAFADWGKIWGNPTAYAEYKIADETWGPDVYELKLLLGDTFLNRFHWGLNFVWEAEIGGEREQEFQIPGGISYTLIDKVLSVGVEFLYDHDTVRNERGDALEQFNIGPSVQLRIGERMHVDFSCQFGVNKDSPRQIGWLIVGYDFGRIGKESDRAYMPVGGLQN
jgi:hypothetical protein